MATFALAHMSCGGAWCWADVARYLRAAQHQVHAPDLDLRPGATPAAHAAQLGEGDVVAGHSYGALPAHVAAARFRALVVIDGFAADDGDSAHGLRPQHAAQRRAQGETWLPEDPLPEMRPMPLSAMETPVAFEALPERRVFAHCVESDFAEQAARASERGFAVAEIEGGHLWPLEQPRACAALLLAAAAPPPPRGERVVLRRWRPEDADAIAQASADEGIQRFNPVLAPFGRAGAERFLAADPGTALRGEAFSFCCAHPGTDAVLGGAGVFHIDVAARVAEIGYWTAPWARRRGVAREAVRLLASWAFALLGLTRIELDIDDANEPSLRLARRLGALAADRRYALYPR
jgi:RimJ/RimL family protein N-acetyltransferase